MPPNQNERSMGLSDFAKKSRSVLAGTARGPSFSADAHQKQNKNIAFFGDNFFLAHHVTPHTLYKDNGVPNIPMQ